LKLPEDYLPVDVAPAATESSHGQHHPLKKKRKSSLMSANGISHQLLASKQNTSRGTGNKKDKKRKSPRVDIESSELEFISSPKSSRQTVGSREKILEAEAMVKSDQKKLQEFCFICRMEENQSSGQIIFCDFPDCYRSYHTVCTPPSLLASLPPSVSSFLL
jgi:hypothetical protein